MTVKTMEERVRAELVKLSDKEDGDPFSVGTFKVLKIVRSECIRELGALAQIAKDEHAWSMLRHINTKIAELDSAQL